MVYNDCILFLIFCTLVQALFPFKFLWPTFKECSPNTPFLPFLFYFSEEFFRTMPKKNFLTKKNKKQFFIQGLSCSYAFLLLFLFFNLKIEILLRIYSENKCLEIYFIAMEQILEETKIKKKKKKLSPFFFPSLESLSSFSPPLLFDIFVLKNERKKRSETN